MLKPKNLHAGLASLELLLVNRLRIVVADIFDAVGQVIQRNQHVVVAGFEHPQILYGRVLLEIFERNASSEDLA